MSAWLLATMTYLLGLRCWGLVAGVVAVVVLFPNGVLLPNLTRSHPDVLPIAILSLAAMCAVLARDRGPPRSCRHRLDRAGRVCFGWGFDVRDLPLRVALVLGRSRAGAG